MRNIWTIARRELSAYFGSPIAYVVAFFILIVVGGLFTASMYLSMQSLGQNPPPGVSVVTGPLMFMLVFACPALTMRLLSEEQRLGTLELMLTAPIRDWELVIGKWLGCFMFVFCVVAVTLIYPVVLNFMVQPGIDKGPLIGGYLGVLLITAAFLGIGTAISSLFSNQVASLLATFVILMVLWWIFDIGAQVAGTGALNAIFQYMSFSGHFYNTLITGVIELSDVIYMVSATILTLSLATISVEMRRWR
jgi:ABC-2 type transport system permease protein